MTGWNIVFFLCTDFAATENKIGRKEANIIQFPLPPQLLTKKHSNFSLGYLTKPPWSIKKKLFHVVTEQVLHVTCLFSSPREYYTKAYIQSEYRDQMFDFDEKFYTMESLRVYGLSKMHKTFDTLPPLSTYKWYNWYLGPGIAVRNVSVYKSDIFI